MIPINHSVTIYPPTLRSTSSPHTLQRTKHFPTREPSRAPKTQGKGRPRGKATSKNNKKFYTTVGDTKDLNEPTVISTRTPNHSHNDDEDGESVIRMEPTKDISIFQLGQLGEVTNLLDSVNFDIDGFLNPNNSIRTRRSCLKHLVNTTVVPSYRVLLRQALKDPSLVKRFHDIFVDLKRDGDRCLLFWGYSLVVSMFLKVEVEPNNHTQNLKSSHLDMNKSAETEVGVLALSFDFFQVVVELALLSSRRESGDMTSPTGTPSYSSPTSTVEINSKSSFHTNTTPNSKRSVSACHITRAESPSTSGTRKGGSFLSKRRKAVKVSDSKGDPHAYTCEAKNISSKLNFTDHDVKKLPSKCSTSSNAGSNIMFSSSVSCAKISETGSSPQTKTNKFRSKRKFALPSSLSPSISSLSPPLSAASFSRTSCLEGEQNSATGNAHLSPTVFLGDTIPEPSVTPSIHSPDTIESNTIDENDDKNLTTNSILPFIWNVLFMGNDLPDAGTADLVENDLFMFANASLLTRFETFLIVRLVGLLIHFATADSCVSASLEFGTEKNVNDSRPKEGGSEVQNYDINSMVPQSAAVLLSRCLNFKRDAGLTYSHCLAFLDLITLSSTTTLSGGFERYVDHHSVVLSGGNTSSLLWLLLMSFESCCFRHPTNQLLLSLPVSKMSPCDLISDKAWAGNALLMDKPFTSIVAVVFRSLSEELLPIIIDITRICETMDEEVEQCDNIGESSEHNHRENFCFPELYKFSKDVTSNDNYNSLNQGLSKFYNERNGCVGLHDTWMNSLKVLVNLTHACEKNCAIVSDDGSVVSVAIKMLVELIACRLARSNQSMSYKSTEYLQSKDEGPEHAPSSCPNMKSKRMKIFDKFIYDAVLFLLTLLSNLVELNNEISERDVESDCGKISEDVPPQIKVAQASAASSRCAQYHTCRVSPLRTCLASLSTKSPSSRKRRSSHKKRADTNTNLVADTTNVSMVSFLLDLFEHETHHMIQDFRLIPTASYNTPYSNDQSSDIVNSNPQLPSLMPSPSSIPLETVSNYCKVSDRNTSLHKNPTAVTSSHSSNKLDLPLDEIVLATHIVLLLHAIHVLGVPVEDQANHVVSSRITGVDIKMAMPTGSWWLPLRVLKAYIALQDQTATLVQENSLPVIQVIQSMQHEDETELKKFSSD